AVSVASRCLRIASRDCADERRTSEVTREITLSLDDRDPPWRHDHRAEPAIAHPAIHQREPRARIGVQAIHELPLGAGELRIRPDPNQHSDVPLPVLRPHTAAARCGTHRS
ncbi:hypothetical protein, partial [Gordonia aichiensis]